MADRQTSTPALGGPAQEHQVVTFFLGDEEFGFDLRSVHEIIRQPSLCRIPMAPDYVEGIAHLRGTVLPILDTRTRFGMKREADTDGTRVLVVDVDGHKTGLRVDRVRQVVRLHPSELEAPPAVLRGGVTSDYLRSVAKLDGGKRIVMALDPRAICAVEGVAVADAIGAEIAVADRLRTVDRLRSSDAADPSVVQLVSFRLGDDEFAFSMAQVREILRVERPSELPDTPDYVIGIVTVRGSILPVVDLRTLLGLRTLGAEVIADAARVRTGFRAWFDAVTALVHDHTATSPGAIGMAGVRAWHAGFSTSSPVLMSLVTQVRAAGDHVDRGLQQVYAATNGASEIFASGVVPFAADLQRAMIDFESRVAACISEDQRLVVVESHGTQLALLVDRVREVLKVPQRLITPPPARSKAGTSEVAGIARLDEGKRLIMILDADELVRRDAIASLDPSGGFDEHARAAREGKTMDRRTGEGDPAAPSDRKFVTFRLGEGEYGIPIEQIQEIDRTAKLTKIPRSAEYVDGITNLRGEIIPVVNARKRFGLPFKEVDEQTRVLILDLDGAKTGLLVDSVREVLNQAQRDIAQPPASIVSGGVDKQYISGIAKADNGKRMIVLLEVAKVLED